MQKGIQVILHRCSPFWSECGGHHSQEIILSHGPRTEEGEIAVSHSRTDLEQLECLIWQVDWDTQWSRMSTSHPEGLPKMVSFRVQRDSSKKGMPFQMQENTIFTASSVTVQYPLFKLILMLQVKFWHFAFYCSNSKKRRKKKQDFRVL